MHYTTLKVIVPLENDVPAWTMSSALIDVGKGYMEGKCIRQIVDYGVDSRGEKSGL